MAYRCKFFFHVGDPSVLIECVRVKQQQMLDKYRQRYFKAQTRLIRAKFPAYPRHQRPLPNLETYDLCCEYYREVYTMQTASSAALYS